MARLNGWKTIAAHLQRDERTAMRWAAERGMPVHRMPGSKRGSVYALVEELDAWMEASRTQPAQYASSPPTMATPAEREFLGVAPLPRWHRANIANLFVAFATVLIGTLALTLRISPPPSPARDPMSHDRAARALFLQASYDWNLRSPVSLARAVREYGAAVAHDPRMSAAYVGLANSYLLLREFGAMPDAEAYGRAQAAAQGAVALSPSSAEAHRALAFIAFWSRQDRDTARREFAQALALRPDDPLTHHWYATALLANGEFDASSREIERARELDPHSTAILADEGLIKYVAGHHSEGLAILHALTTAQPDAIDPHRWLGEIALSEGRVADFLRESDTTARLRSDDAGLSNVRLWQAAGSDRASIEQAMLRDAERRRTGWFQIARLEALAGRRDQARDALARACNAREPATISAASDLLLARAMSRSDVASRCGPASPLA